jgi:hypothetical protein
MDHSGALRYGVHEWRLAMKSAIRFAVFAVALPVLILAAATPGHAGETGVPTGILYDRVAPISRISDHTGSLSDRPVQLNHWRQMYHEIRRASLEDLSCPSLHRLRKMADEQADRRRIPIAIMDFNYNRTDMASGECRDHRVFAATALRDYTHRGKSVVFAFDEAWLFTNDAVSLDGLEVDFDDAQGPRTVWPAGETIDLRVSAGDGGVRPAREFRVSYRSTGRKTIKVRLRSADGSVLHGSFYFNVRQLQTPEPHDTLAITATIPYLGEYGSGQAYVYLSDSHNSLTNPVLVIEGFDIDNTMDWEFLYETMNQEGMIESLRTRGFDGVVLDFTDATDYIQRNSFVAVELMEQVNSMIPPGADLAVVGASMGGLIGRYALSYMEMNAIDHNVRTFISFDAPQKGANIPLGMQYWIKFFSGQSADAELMLQQLGTPAPRQMLVYYLTDPPGTTGESDPLFAEIQSDFEALGGYPANVRKVAIANGSGHMMDQGFAPGEQIIFYEYNSLLVDILGNVWAVPDGTNHIIFDGLLDLIWPFPDDQLVVYVEGTLPYDSAPGGTRSSMAEMDSTEAPYGDIVALHDNHCFIPTISAIDLDTTDLFYDIAGDPDILSRTPFDTVYCPVENQEHVSITSESVNWFLNEIERGVQSGAPGPGMTAPDIVLQQSCPNPFGKTATIRFCMPESSPVRVEVLNVAGRKVADLLDSTVPAGWGAVVWDGKDNCGRPVSSGIYFCRLASEDKSLTRRMVFLR